MFRLEGTEKEKAILEKYLPNYRINLVDAERLEETERFSEDLQVILTMLKYRKDKDGLRNYVNENKQFFQKVDHETSQAMKAFLNMKHIPGETENKEEAINMCEAMDRLFKRFEDRGMEKGETIGFEKGERSGIEKGKREEKQNTLKEQLKVKLGTLSRPLEKQKKD